MSLFNKDARENQLGASLAEKALQLSNIHVDVKVDYGAKGDGTADDTQSILNAINYLNGIGGGKIYFPATTGKYIISQTLPIYPNISFEGVERSSVTLRMTTDNYMFANSTGSIVKSVSWKNLSFESTSSNHHLFNLGWVNNCLFERLQFNNCVKGMLLDGSNQCYYNTFFDVKFSYCTTGLELIGKANRNNFSNCNFIDYTTGVLLTSGDGNVFTNCGFETFLNSVTGKIGVSLQAAATRNSFFGCVFEMHDTGGYPFYSNGSDSNLVVTSYIFSGTQSPAYRGIDGTGTNNTVISPLSGSNLTNVTSIASKDDTFGQLWFYGKSKTPNDATIRFQTYKADNATLQSVMNIYGSIDNPRVYVYPTSILYSAAGTNSFENDISFVTSGKGLSLKSTDGTKTDRVTLNNSEQLVVGNYPIGRYVSVPASATATGVVGDWSADASYLYMCHAANTWKRVAIVTW